MRPSITLAAALTAATLFTLGGCSDDPAGTADATDTVDDIAADTAVDDTSTSDTGEAADSADAAEDTLADGDTGTTDSVEPDTTTDTVEPDTVEPDTTADTVEPDTTADTVELDTSTSDDGGGPQVALTFHLVEFLSLADLDGLELTIGAETVTTDADGEATLHVTAGADYVLVITGDDIRDHYIYARATNDDAAFRYQIAVNETITTLATAFGITLDADEAIVDLAPRDEDGGDIAGMTLGIDASSDLQLVFDEQSASLVSLGDTTLAGSESTTIFANVPAGAVTPSFSHPWGYTCDVGPNPIDVPAGSYVIAEYRCSYAPVTQTFGLSDFVTGAAVVGATVEAFGQTLTTDDNGTVAVVTPPNADILVAITGEGFRDHYFYLRTRSTDAAFTYSLATDSSIAALEAILGQQVDDGDGILAVAPRELDTLANLGEVTVSVDQSYDLALVFDSSSDYGLSPGTTTIVGSQATVIFVNVTPTEVTPSFTDAAGHVCDIGPASVDVPAGSYVIANYQCAVP